MNFPEDVVTEILLRFPVKSVLRFRCVSKNWCTQIDSLEFRKMHLAFRKARYDDDYDYDYDDEFLVVNSSYIYLTDSFGCRMNVLSCYDDYESLSDLKSSCDLDIDSIYFSSFSYHINGIVCVILNGLIVYLCNPALREIRQLPKFPPFPIGFGITCPYRISAVGIGFDEDADDYVVVQFVHPDPDEDNSAYDLKCVSYNVKTQSWTIIEIPTPFVSTHASTLKRRYSSFENLYASFFSHGCIHWCMGWCHLILTLNMNTKLFQEIQFPRGWKDYHYDDCAYLLKVDSSSIALVGMRDFNKLDIWVMKEYGVADSWVKQYSIITEKYHRRGLSPAVSSLPRISRPLSFYRKDKLFLLTFCQVICYDLSRGQLYEHPRRGQSDPASLPHPDMKPLQVVSCCGSLVSVHQS